MHKNEKAVAVSKNSERLRKLIKSQIPLNNDVFMVFATSKEFCQEFLRVILQDKKLVVLENDIQKYLPSAFSKNIVLDMLCKLANGDVVNVEIQLTNERWHAKRIFTYASKIKSYLIEKGKKYKDIKDIIVIYLTKEDIFKKGSTVYEVEMNIVSDQDAKVGRWDAGLRVYYVNAKGLTNRSINEYLKILMDKTTISKKYKRTSGIKKELYEIGGQVMSKEMQKILNDERAEGRAEGSVKAIINMFKKGIIKIQDAADELGITESAFKKMVKA